MSHIDAKAETKGVEAPQFDDNYSEAAAFAGITFSQACQFDMKMRHLLGKGPAPGFLPPDDPKPQRHARINCNGKSFGEVNCDTCHPQEGELPPEYDDDIIQALLGCIGVIEGLAPKAAPYMGTVANARKIIADRVAALKATPKTGETFNEWWAAYEEEDNKNNNLPSRYHAARTAWKAAQSSPTLPLEEPEQVISDGDINWIKTFGSSTLCKAMSELEAHRRALAARRGGR
jgi:hypothetical protein